MLQTRADMEAELVSRLMAANNSALFPSTRITELIAQATKWAGSLYFWPSLLRARVFTSQANTQSLNYDYYDYPTDFLTGSVSRLYIDGKKYELKTFQTFLDYVDNTQEVSNPPDVTKRYVSNYGRQFFVWPVYTGTPTTGNAVVWGNIQHPDLTLTTSTTIFSQWDDSGNEAIVKKAFSVGMRRLEAQLAAAEEQGSIQLLAVMWKKVTDEMQKSVPLNHPFFNVPDFFSGSSGVSTIGQFNTDVIIGR